MSFPSRLPLIVALTAVMSGSPGAMAALPVLADPLASENGSVRVVPTIPVGKTLVLPLLASDADGDVLDFTVTSSNPKIMARVRTGCPILKIHASYTGDPGASPNPWPAFEGDMEFQLFRDVTPATVGSIGGAGQAGFYENVIFHRVVPGFVIQGGDKTGTGSGEPGFSSIHEYRPELIFSGRGQLAMAHSKGGYERGTAFGSQILLGNFDPTNSSQFFVTTAQPRTLDFLHTIFGQLLRGFDVLDKVVAVPRNANDRPNVDVKMTMVAVVPGKSDATLLLSATAVGTATLTVTARDPSGALAVRRIVVTARKDDTNDPPLLRPLPNLITPVGVAPGLPLRAFDLEHDYLLYGIAAAGENTTNTTPRAAFGTAKIVPSFSPLNTSGAQDIVVGVAGFNDPRLGTAASSGNPFAPFDPYRFQVAEIGYGDRAVTGEPVAIEGTAGTALTDVVLAEFRSGNPKGDGNNFTAKVQWGDGTAAVVSNPTTGTATISITPSATTPGAFVVRGTHTFVKAGVYTNEVIVDGSFGATVRTRGQAVVVAPGATLRAAGVEMQNAGAVLSGRVLATFSDTTPGVQAADFSARIDWGDGRNSAGQIVAKGSGKFAVLGSHAYRDPETFSVFAHIERATPSAASAVAWSQVQALGFTAPQHLPPFPAAHLVGQISQASDAFGNAIPFITTTGTGSRAQTRFAFSIVVLNSGNVASNVGSLRFYLSKDTKFNAARVGDQPADIRLPIGSFPEGNLPSLKPRAGLRYDITRTVNAAGAVQDLRLLPPLGQNGASYFILAHLGYSDPIADQLPISKDVAFGRINGIAVSKTALTVTEVAGATHTQTFTVVLKGRPIADVKIPLSLSNAQVQIDTVQLTFTAANWNVPQTVTVTAVDDTTHENTTTTDISVGPTESTDESWDGMSGASVRAFVTDNDPV